MGESGHHNAREPVLGWESGFGLESSPALWDLKEVTLCPGTSSPSSELHDGSPE